MNIIEKAIVKFYSEYEKGINVNPMELNESPSHNYFKVMLPTLNHFYLAGNLFHDITNVVAEPYYKDYIKNAKFPYPKRRADLAFTFNGEDYLIEFVYSNKNVKGKIQMAKQFHLNLIIIDANGFYSDSEIKILQKEGKQLSILFKFDTFLRNLLMRKKNNDLVDIYKF